MDYKKRSGFQLGIYLGNWEFFIFFDWEYVRLPAAIGRQRDAWRSRMYAVKSFL